MTFSPVHDAECLFSLHLYQVIEQKGQGWENALVGALALVCTIESSPHAKLLKLSLVMFTFIS